MGDKGIIRFLVRDPGFGEKGSVRRGEVVLRSCEIETLEDALRYYARLVGDHEITVSGQALTIHFAADETHPFTEGLKDGSNAPAALLVRRKGRSDEVRIFSRQRARRLDDILVTLQSPAGCVAAKGPDALMVFGPCSSNGQRMAVVIYLRGRAYVVRTAYTIDSKQFAQLTSSRMSRRLPWPPK